MLHKDLVFIFNSYTDFKMTVKLENSYAFKGVMKDYKCYFKCLI